MRKHRPCLNLALFAGLGLCLLGSLACLRGSASTGFPTRESPLPEGIPRRVAVVDFEGDRRVRDQASERFVFGLMKLGFLVETRPEIHRVLRGIDFHNYQIDLGTRGRLQELGIDGLFIGSVVSEETGVYAIDVQFKIRLIDLGSGLAVWGVETHDPRFIRFRPRVETSAERSVLQALHLLTFDLEDLRLEAEARTAEPADAR